MPFVTLQSDWQSLADKAFKAINGDNGGAYAPSSAITINGAGMVVTGPADVDYGGILKTSAASRFKLGNNEWPSLAVNHVGRMRDLRSPMHTRLCTPRYHFVDSAIYPGSIQSMAMTVLTASTSSAVTIEQPKCIIHLRTHDGARLTSGRVKLRVASSRFKAPVAMPRIRIIRVDADGKIDSLRAASSTVDADGYSPFPLVSSGDAWYAAGAVQNWAFTCDQNNIVDLSLYAYYAQIIEEVGTSDPTFDTTVCDGTIVRERKRDVVYTFDQSVPSLSGNPNPVPNGPTLVTGNEVLVTTLQPPGYQPEYNGIWVVNTAGPWTRRTDATSNSDFTPNFIVFDTNSGILWECVNPKYGQSVRVAQTSVAVPNASQIQFSKRAARGNIYHSLTCSFDSITDMRPQ